MKRCMLPVVMVLFIFLNVNPCFSQTKEELKAIKNELNALKEGQKEIRKELQEIKSLLRAKPGQPAEFKEAIINIEGAHFKGDNNAKLAVIEFSDYQ